MVIVQTRATESTTYGGTCTLATLSCAGTFAANAAVSSIPSRLTGEKPVSVNVTV